VRPAALMTPEEPRGRALGSLRAYGERARTRKAFARERIEAHEGLGVLKRALRAPSRSSGLAIAELERAMLSLNGGPQTMGAP
jgi:hypothetical protein